MDVGTSPRKRKRQSTLVAKTGNVTVKISNEEEAKLLLGRFPQEIWHLIFDHCEPSLLQNLCNSSLIFRNWLLARRTVFLFDKVLEILESKNRLSEPINNNPENRRARESCRSCGKQRYTRWYSTLLTLRLVCKTWCCNVNQFLSTSLLRSISVERVLLAQIEFSDKFVLHFRSTSFNKKLTLFTKYMRIRIPFYHHAEDTLKLVQMYGEYVKECFISTMYISTTEFYTSLKQILDCMKNAVTLSIDSHSLTGAEDCKELQNLISLNGMELLPNLNILILYGIPTQIQYEIVSNSPNVSSLIVKSVREESRGHLGTNWANAPLRQLRSLYFIVNSAEMFESLKYLPNTCAVKFLELEFRENAFVEWPTIFSLIEQKFGNSLEALTLCLPKGRDEEEKKRVLRWSLESTLNLPRLNRLVLELNTFQAVDFILPMQERLIALEILIRHGYFPATEVEPNMEEVKKEERIQFVGRHTKEHFMESNLWNIFDKLQMFRYFGTSTNQHWWLRREEWTKHNQALPFV